jgi:choline dehydrogenase-like flavoprotein
MVGRNLMFHAVQRFVMWSTRKLPSTGPRKSISFRDFYLYQGERLGSVQSSGFEAGYGDLLMHFYSVFDRSRLRKLRLLRPFLRIPAMLAIKIFGRGTIFNCCLEDFPYPDNRVVLDPEQDDGIRMQYTVREELKYRNQRFHEMLKKHLDPRRTIFSAPVVDLNFSHACGTCVMGDDPTKSVVDRNGKAHGIDNLYIADASFMPTSAAINPSLTVAANALRVADAIKAAFAKSILESPFEQTAG